MAGSMGRVQASRVDYSTSWLLVLPIVALAIPVSGPITQLLVRSFASEFRAGYVTTSRAKGAPRNAIVVGDVFRNASLPALTIAQLYKSRWQIELLFKRLKSLLHLDTLPSRQGPTARSWILARLLAAALAQKLVQPSGPFSPWGYELLPAANAQSVA